MRKKTKQATRQNLIQAVKVDLSQIEKGVK
jgi:hypothetical protein